MLKTLLCCVLYAVTSFLVQCSDDIGLYERGSAVLEKHACGQD